MNDPAPIEVCCAIILHQGKVLIAQRNARTSNAGKWEFPGGKVEKGESPGQCILREIQEELSVRVQIQERLKPVEHAYPEKTIKLIPFICTLTDIDVVATEHIQIKWIEPAELSHVNWSAADVKVWHQFMKSGSTD